MALEQTDQNVLVEEIAISTQTVYLAVEQLARSASELATAGQQSVKQAKLLPYFWKIFFYNALNHENATSIFFL